MGLKELRERLDGRCIEFNYPSVNHSTRGRIARINTLTTSEAKKFFVLDKDGVTLLTGSNMRILTTLAIAGYYTNRTKDFEIKIR